jgi:PIN domain nuclease of toxin-antitoxin system
VVDASAVLAVLRDEPIAATDRPLLANGLISAVNVAEVVAKLSDFGAPVETIHAALRDMSLAVEPFDEEAALLSGQLRVETRQAGLSLGDRACLALAKRHRLVALTTDRGWLKVADAIGVEVRCIRPE